MADTSEKPKRTRIKILIRSKAKTAIESFRVLGAEGSIKNKNYRSRKVAEAKLGIIYMIAVAIVAIFIISVVRGVNDFNRMKDIKRMEAYQAQTQINFNAFLEGYREDYISGKYNDLGGLYLAKNFSEDLEERPDFLTFRNWVGIVIREPDNTLSIGKGKRFVIRIAEHGAVYVPLEGYPKRPELDEASLSASARAKVGDLVRFSGKFVRWSSDDAGYFRSFSNEPLNEPVLNSVLEEISIIE